VLKEKAKKARQKKRIADIIEINFLRIIKYVAVTSTAAKLQTFARLTYKEKVKIMIKAFNQII
jgi:hypothetical protein